MNLLSFGVMVGNWTGNCAGKLLNSSFLDVFIYEETRQTSLVSRNIFRFRMTCVISVVVWLIAFSCLSIAAMCWASMSSISNFITWIMLSISKWRASPCLSRAFVSFWEWFLTSALWTGMFDAFFWYIGWIVFCNSSKSCLMSSSIFGRFFKMSTLWCRLCLLEETLSEQIGMRHCWHCCVQCFVEWALDSNSSHFKWHYVVFFGLTSEMFFLGQARDTEDLFSLRIPTELST